MLKLNDVIFTYRETRLRLEVTPLTPSEPHAFPDHHCCHGWYKFPPRRPYFWTNQRKFRTFTPSAYQQNLNVLEYRTALRALWGRWAEWWLPLTILEWRSRGRLACGHERIRRRSEAIARCTDMQLSLSWLLCISDFTGCQPYGRFDGFISRVVFFHFITV